jgi:hypothetical protein
MNADTVQPGPCDHIKTPVTTRPAWRSSPPMSTPMRRTRSACCGKSEPTSRITKIRSVSASLWIAPLTEPLLDFFHFFRCLTLHLEESFPTGRVFGSPVISAKSMQVHDAQRGAIPRSAPAAGRSDRSIPNDRGPQWHSQRSLGAAGWRLTSTRNSHRYPRIVPLMRRQRSTALELLRSCLIVMLRMAKVAIRLG